MNEQQIISILNLLHTLQEACQELYNYAANRNAIQFQRLFADMADGIEHICCTAGSHGPSGNEMLESACKAIADSLRRVNSYHCQDNQKCLKKIEYELLPLLQEAYQNFYFFEYLRKYPEALSDYYERDSLILGANAYIDEAIETGRYKYEVSIIVLAYNKLEYTMKCVESLLANMPKGLNYELILVNHGSSDGTKEYFETIHPDKQLDIAVNGGGLNSMCRIVEGEFTLQISNDVIVAPNAIANLLNCIRSDPKIAWVVPSTSNISNLQTIPAHYGTLDELEAFAQQNNHADTFRWEQRVRLCNPIHIIRNSFVSSSKGCISAYYHTFNPVYCNAFPDDRISLLLRRNGYKMMLAKDAYCHHFGSVTLKDEIAQQNEQKYYTEGRQEFYNAFGVDPWGTGSCFDPVFLDRVVGEDHGHTEILGINCGLGSNSLKIKEQIKEYCHNVDTRLSNITDDPSFLADLKGISDTAETVSTIKGLKDFLKGHTYQYIVWETPFLAKYKFKTVLNCCMDTLSPNGKLIIKLTSQARALISRDFPNRKELGNDWTICDCGECR